MVSNFGYDFSDEARLLRSELKKAKENAALLERSRKRLSELCSEFIGYDSDSNEFASAKSYKCRRMSSDQFIKWSEEE